MRHIAVIDIGKTNAKLLIVDLTTGRESTVAKRANAVLSGPPYPHYDIGGLWDFLLDGLRQLARSQAIDAISITTHGAACALVDASGGLALPVLDYEFAGPDSLAQDYAAARPGFDETGAPRLPGGLNLGAQLFWQSRIYPADFARARHILMYPQYWAFRLTGVAASEPTSLGCHTDLWNPWTAGFSALVDRMGWHPLFAPVKSAASVLGPILPEIAKATGLPPNVPVLCGIHDSNASLLPHLGQPGPLAVVSTGTWMISMAIDGSKPAMDARRDTLVFVNAKGQPTPTARFMAGREFDELTEGRAMVPEAADVAAVLADRVMAMPSLYPDTGPFPGMKFVWTKPPADERQRVVAASFYTALMGAECLALIGAAGPVVVEGPFGGNAEFARMLATATGRPVVATGQSAGTGLGAAMLAGPVLAPKAEPVPVLPETGAAWLEYVAAWRGDVQRRWAAGHPI